MRIEDILPFLSPSVARYVLDDLFSVLPAPVPDTPEARDARDAAAVSRLVAMRPENAADVMLAVQVIAADAHAMDSLRCANQPGVSIGEFLRWQSVAISLMRASNSSRSLLLRMQKDRLKRATAVRPPSRPVVVGQKPVLAVHPAQGKPPLLH